MKRIGSYVESFWIVNDMCFCIFKDLMKEFVIVIFYRGFGMCRRIIIGGSEYEEVRVLWVEYSIVILGKWIL